MEGMSTAEQVRFINESAKPYLASGQKQG